MSDNYERLRLIFTEVLGLPADRDPSTAAAGEAWNWDSLAHVSLVAAMESEFGVSIDVDRSLTMTSFSSAAGTLRDLGVEFGSGEVA